MLFSGKNLRCERSTYTAGKKLPISGSGVTVVWNIIMAL
jgi:hypothetical protein